MSRVYPERTLSESEVAAEGPLFRYGSVVGRLNLFRGENARNATTAVIVGRILMLLGEKSV